LSTTMRFRHFGNAVGITRIFSRKLPLLKCCEFSDVVLFYALGLERTFHACVSGSERGRVIASLMLRFSPISLLLVSACAYVSAQTKPAQWPEAPSPAVAENQQASATQTSPGPPHELSTSASASANPKSLKPNVQFTKRPTYGQQPKRILGIMPNIRAVSVGEHVPAPSTKEKFWLATANSIDYSAFISIAFESIIPFVGTKYPQFGEGPTAYGRYYWRDLLDRTAGQYFTNAIIPTIRSEDTRYYTMGKGAWYKRLAYASTRVIITPNDEGKNTFNFSEIIGKGAASGLGNLYYPGGPSWSNTEQRWIERVSLDSAYGIFREFWPDIARRLHRPVPPPPKPPLP
jgi:hypothetical protein